MYNHGHTSVCVCAKIYVLLFKCVCPNRFIHMLYVYLEDPKMYLYICAIVSTVHLCMCISALPCMYLCVRLSGGDGSVVKKIVSCRNDSQIEEHLT